MERAEIYLKEAEWVELQAARVGSVACQRELLDLAAQWRELARQVVELQLPPISAARHRI